VFSISDCPFSPWQAKQAAARSPMVSAFAEKASDANASAVITLRID
jgi:hypothetical protein